jgi:hypothetical protein
MPDLNRLYRQFRCADVVGHAEAPMTTKQLYKKLPEDRRIPFLELEAELVEVMGRGMPLLPRKGDGLTRGGHRPATRWRFVHRPGVRFDWEPARKLVQAGMILKDAEAVGFALEAVIAAYAFEPELV